MIIKDKGWIEHVAATPRQITPPHSPPGSSSNIVTISNQYVILDREHSIASQGTNKSPKTDTNLNQNNINNDDLIGIDIKMSETTKPDLSSALDTTKPERAPMLLLLATLSRTWVKYWVSTMTVRMLEDICG